MASSDHPKFFIPVPVYNAAPWIARCIESVLAQTCPDFRLVVVDDASTDQTPAILEQYERGDPRCTVVHNPVNVGGSLANIVWAIRTFAVGPDQIIFPVDGDDWLSDPEVFSCLAAAYENPDVWMTYGSFRSTNGLTQPCRRVDEPALYRRRTWSHTCPRTFRRWLWDRIPDDYLRDVDGSYYRSASDVAVTYALLEMAGKNHAGFISRTLYVYNEDNPIGDRVIRLYEQAWTHRRIQIREPLREVTRG